MKEHFLRLFDYDQMANTLIFAALRDTPPGETDRAQVLMEHLLTASKSWLIRCEGKSSAGIDLWPRAEWGEMGTLINENAKGWKAFLEKETDFGRRLTYQNQSGKDFSNVLADALTHVINHGTHHRAQIGQLLKIAGVEHLPVTDYIAFLRLKGL